MTKLLLVEDDRDMATMISEWLTSQNFLIDVSHDGATANAYLKDDVYDCIILDWQLPDTTGVEILNRYRAGGGMTPIIMLTAKGSINDKETGFESGADDYLTKPFSLKELSARIRALLRRPAEIVSQVYKISDLVLDPVKHRVTKGGVEVRLLPRDFALLEFLMKHKDEVFSTDALLQRVWHSDSEATSDALRTAIKRIRKKIDTGDDEGASAIENIPRIGYRMRG